ADRGAVSERFARAAARQAPRPTDRSGIAGAAYRDRRQRSSSGSKSDDGQYQPAGSAVGGHPRNPWAGQQNFSRTLAQEGTVSSRMGRKRGHSGGRSDRGGRGRSEYLVLG